MQVTPVFLALTVGLFVFGPTRAADFKEFSCQALSKGKAVAPGEVFGVASLRESESLVVPLPADKTKEMVMCVRSLLVASVNDGKVIDAGFALFVGTPDGRIAALVGQRPEMVMVEVEGKFTKSELELLDKTLKVINGS